MRSNSYLLVGIDRTRKFAFTRLVEKAGKMAAAQFLCNRIAHALDRLHTGLTELKTLFLIQRDQPSLESSSRIVWTMVDACGHFRTVVSASTVGLHSGVMSSIA